MGICKSPKGRLSGIHHRGSSGHDALTPSSRDGLHTNHPIIKACDADPIGWIYKPDTVKIQTRKRLLSDEKLAAAGTMWTEAWKWCFAEHNHPGIRRSHGTLHKCHGVLLKAFINSLLTLKLARVLLTLKCRMQVLSIANNSKIHRVVFLYIFQVHFCLDSSSLCLIDHSYRSEGKFWKNQKIHSLMQSSSLTKKKP